jgi:hypothetical protein
MFIATKDSKLIAIHETEWQCRKNSKGMTKPEYWTWIASITTQDDDGNDVVTYPSEDFTIVECSDEDVQARLNQLGDYINSNRSPDEALVYNIKWSDSKVNCEEVLDIDGKSQSPKVYVKSHFKGDDTAKDARLLAEKWTAVRRDRDQRLAETDYLALSDSTLASNMKTYRQKLRDVPNDNSDPGNISWPSKP